MKPRHDSPLGQRISPLGSEPASVPAPRGILAKIVALAGVSGHPGLLVTGIPRQGRWSRPLRPAPGSSWERTRLQVLWCCWRTPMPPQCLWLSRASGSDFLLIFLARGASYILGILNYALGQGALGLYLQRSGVADHAGCGEHALPDDCQHGGTPVSGQLRLVGRWLPGVGSTLDLSLLGYGLLAGSSAVSRRYRAYAHASLQGYQLQAPLIGGRSNGHLRAAVGRLPHVATPGPRLLGGPASLGDRRPPGAGCRHGAPWYCSSVPCPSPPAVWAPPRLPWCCCSARMSPSPPGGPGCRSVSLRSGLLFLGDCRPGSAGPLVLAATSSYLLTMT